MSTWHSDGLDFSAYLRRIGGSPMVDSRPTLDTLRTLHMLHVLAIPFENLEIIAGRSVPLDLDAVQRKLVDSRRGGYCFEHVTLFAAALERIGFRFTALSGRVTLGADGGRPATHALLVVELDDGSRHLCDVGFGRGPLTPIPLVDGVEEDQDGWRFRLSCESLGSDSEVFHPDQWTLWQHDADGWIDRHVFTLNPQYPIDFAVGNHFVSTAPRSPFRSRTFVQRFGIDEHHTLDGLTLTTTQPDGTRVESSIAADSLPEVLTSTFGIHLGSDDAATVVAAEAARISR